MEAAEGPIFSVKGLVHPPDRLIAYLRYMPCKSGERRRGAVAYERVYGFDRQQDLLRARFPQYICHDPAFGTELQSVPWQCACRIYDPCQGLADIRKRGAVEPLEKNALAFASVLSKAAGIPMESLGISGSLLIGLHRPQSDLDMVVYGQEEGYAVREAMRHLMDDRSGLVRRLDEGELRSLHSSHLADTPLSFSDFAAIQSRKVNEGYFAETPYFIRFVKLRREIEEQYGNPVFKSLRTATIEFQVNDARDAVFTPCRYGIDKVVFIDHGPEVDLRETVSFRGRFSDQVRPGEQARARGIMERVTIADGSVHYRLMVGGQIGDFLVVVR